MMPSRSAPLALALFLSLVAAATAAERRAALVIGNAAYVHSAALANPVNDAREMAATLNELGFSVILGLDLDRKGFEERIRAFAATVENADAAVLFYAGHGLQVGGHNYLIPVDAKLERERDLDFEGVRLDFVLRQMEIERTGRTNIVFLDACRDNPLARNLARAMGTRSAGIGQGLAQVQGGVGTFIAFSTQPGNVALDGDGRNSPFTTSLVKGIRQKDLSLTGVMIGVRKEVLAATQGRQVPWDHSALTGEFYFHPAALGGPGTRPSAPPTPAAEAEAMKERLRALEQELKTRADAATTARMIELSQLKERQRQLAEALKADQARVFDLQRKMVNTSDSKARMELQMELSRTHQQLGRRSQESRQLKEDIAKLEGEAGAATAAGAKGK